MCDYIVTTLREIYVDHKGKYFVICTSKFVFPSHCKLHLIFLFNERSYCHILNIALISFRLVKRVVFADGL